MNKKTRSIVAIVLLVAFIGWLFFTVFPFGGAETKVRNRNPSGTIYEPKFRDEGDLIFISEGDTIKKIDIELAESPEEIQYGMMYRKSMDEGTGMLFMMGEERQQSFWMKNTYVPLDMIFINSRNEIVSIQKNAQPLTEDSRPSEGPASMVLEVYGGFSDKYGIKKGDRIAFSRP